MGQQASALYRAAGILVLNGLVLWAGLELGAGAVLALVRTAPVKRLIAQVTGRPNDIVAHYQTLPYYAGQDWSPEYWREHRLALGKTYYPYALWRSTPFDGNLINIDDNGVRQTPGADCSPEAFRVFAFGGSAMWGWGAPDWATIPAYLQSLLQEKAARPICIVNYGENAYVSIQSLILLQILLDSGDVPDAVIFYDGVNEVLAASQTGRPILHQNFAEVAGLFQPPEHPLVAWARSSNSLALLELALPQVRGSARGGDTGLSGETDALIDSIVQAYLGNYRAVGALAGAYGFEHYFFWQPHLLIGDKVLTREETGMITGLNWILDLDPALTELFSETYGRIELEAASADRLYYLGPAFDDVGAQVWIDTWGHVTPEGNRLIAEWMLAAMEKSLAEN